MAIIKQAKNIRLYIRKEYTSFAVKTEEIAKKIFVNSTIDDLVLSSNKKVIANGNKQ